MKRIAQIVLSLCLSALLSSTAYAEAVEFFFSSLTSGEINRSPVDEPEATEIRGFLSVSSTILAVNSEDRKIYVLDYETGGGVIRRYDLNGTKATVIVSGISSPRGMTLDTVNNKIYYSGGSIPAFIERCDLDGSNVERIVSNSSSTVGLKQLRVDPVGGKIYWVEDDTSDHLKRADLADGANEENLISFGTTHSDTPIALDLDAGKVYYGLDSLNEIWRANLDGTSQELVLGGANGPSAVALEVESNDGDPILYFIDGNQFIIGSYDVNSGTLTTLINLISGGYGAQSGLAILLPVALTPDTQIDEAPDFDLIEGTRKVELSFREFDGIDLTESAVFANAATISAVNILRYDATIRNVTTNAIKRVVTANTKATVKLPPGNYTASYRVRFGERRSTEAKKNIVEKAKSKIEDLKSKPKTTAVLNKIQNQIAKKLLAPVKGSGATSDSPTTEAFTIPN